MNTAMRDTVNPGPRSGAGRSSIFSACRIQPTHVIVADSRLGVPMNRTSVLVSPSEPCHPGGLPPACRLPMRLDGQDCQLPRASRARALQCGELRRISRCPGLLWIPLVEIHLDRCADGSLWSSRPAPALGTDAHDRREAAHAGVLALTPLLTEADAAAARGRSPAARASKPPSSQRKPRRPSKDGRQRRRNKADEGF